MIDEMSAHGVSREIRINFCDTLQNGEWVGTTFLSFFLQLLKKMNPNVQGLENPSLFCFNHYFPSYNSFFINIILINQNHWVCISNNDCQSNQINYYDSLSVVENDKQSPLERRIKNIAFNKHIIRKMVLSKEKMLNNEKIEVKIQPVQLQSNCYDCGLFSIANAYFLAQKKNPVDILLEEEELRKHLNRCVIEKELIPIPFKKKTRNNETCVCLY